jgi:D-alanyl-D-alanine carboxypeptidase/D-alanyl-D-alanine-endopeptidase (penicillin-binding protein 4)
MSRTPRHLLATTAATALAVAAGLLLAPAAQADPTIDGLLSHRLVNPRLGHHVALLVVDLGSGAVLSDHGSGEPMLPASNMKIVTAVNALAALGAQTRFTTTVHAGATPTEVILEGGGDPLLSSTEVKDLATATAANLAASVPAGTPITVHIDDDMFSGPDRAPGWPGGYIPSVVSSVHALALAYDYSRDPSAHAAAAFVADLTKDGYPATLGTPADGTAAPVIAQSPGHTVDQDVHVMLRVSENNVAEVLHRQVARALGLPADWAGSQQAAEQELTSLGIDPAGTALKDGSGLSRDDRVTPAFLVNVLKLAESDPTRFGTMFDGDALPVAGKSGTLDSRYGRFVTKHARCAQGAVQAKTGTLFDTIGLSGVATATDGSKRLFSILVNDRPQRFSELSTRQAVDGLAATIVGCWH